MNVQVADGEEWSAAVTGVQETEKGKIDCGTDGLKPFSESLCCSLHLSSHSPSTYRSVGVRTLSTKGAEQSVLSMLETVVMYNAVKGLLYPRL